MTDTNEAVVRLHADLENPLLMPGARPQVSAHDLHAVLDERAEDDEDENFEIGYDDSLRQPREFIRE